MFFSKRTSIVAVVLLLSACHYKINKEGSGIGTDGGGGNVVAGKVDFATVRAEIIAPKCLECHSSAGGNRGGVNLETYASVKAEVAAIRSAVASNSMPLNRAPLTENQKSLLNKWIDSGAPETVAATPPPETGAPPAPGPAPEPVGPALDWLTVRTLVVEPKCLTCHSAPTNRAGVNLETYQNVLSNLTDVEITIKDGSMPRRTTLSAEQKKLILDWIAAGAPEFAKTNP